MSVAECQIRVSIREFKLWDYWLNSGEFLTPDQWYLAQIAAEVRRVLHKHPAKVKLEDFRLRREKKTGKPKDKAKATRSILGTWMARLGLGGKKRDGSGS